MLVVDIFMRRTHNVNVALSTIKLQLSSKGFTSGLLNVVYRTGQTAYNGIGRKLDVCLYDDTENKHLINSLCWLYQGTDTMPQNVDHILRVVAS